MFTFTFQYAKMIIIFLRKELKNMKPEKKLPLYGPELSEKDYEAIKISEAQIERGEVIKLDEAFKLLGKKYSKQ